MPLVVSVPDVFDWMTIAYSSLITAENVIVFCISAFVVWQAVKYIRIIRNFAR
jgi:hypothetical protein